MARTPDFIDLLADPDFLQLMLFNCPDGVIATDRDHKVVLYTGASEKIFGFEPIDVLQKDVGRLFADPERYPEFLSLLDDNGSVVSLVMRAARKGGQPFSAAVSASRLSDRYGVSGMVLYVRDDTKVQAIEAALRDRNEELNEANGRLAHVASHDQMTGLLNRSSAMEAARQAILAAGIQDRQFGVAVFDLDHFKAVNDSYGHLIGDEVLPPSPACCAQPPARAISLGVSVERSLLPSSREPTSRPSSASPKGSVPPSSPPPWWSAGKSRSARRFQPELRRFQLVPITFAKPFAWPTTGSTSRNVPAATASLASTAWRQARRPPERVHT